VTGIIARVEAFTIRLPLPRELRLGAMVIRDREYVFVRLYDDAGTCGTAYHLSRSAPIAAVVHRTLLPYWQGQPLDEHPRLYAHSVRANVALGTNGIFWRALSLVDCALYDLLARRAGQSAAAYLGGRLRPVPAMMVGGYPVPDASLADLQAEAQQLAALRPTAIKIGATTDPYLDTQRLAACRQVLPRDLPLMIDYYWSVEDVTAFASAAQGWGELNIGWLEDPVAFDDYDGLAYLAQHMPCPVAVGDEQSGVRQFTHLMDAGIGIVRLDATVCGGVRAFVAIASMAAARGLRVACHVYHHIHAQLACAVPGVAWVETMPHWGGLDAAHLVMQHDLALRDGTLHPQGTGWGWDWDEDKLAYYREG
jgi:L-alanine-DL-glutamate epimerase-like enolase superfamily enzyme